MNVYLGVLTLILGLTIIIASLHSSYTGESSKEALRDAHKMAALYLIAAAICFK